MLIVFVLIVVVVLIAFFSMDTPEKQYRRSRENVEAEIRRIKLFETKTKYTDVPLEDIERDDYENEICC